jgi:methylthioribose-1-phosphate isomerase
VSNPFSIPIEHRPPIEATLVRGQLYPPDDSSQQAVVQFTPPGLEGIYNPSFDVTPAELISAIVTEKGVAVKKDNQRVYDLGTSTIV